MMRAMRSTDVTLALCLSLVCVSCGSSSEPSTPDHDEPGEATGGETGSGQSPARSAQSEYLESLSLPAGPDGTVLCSLGGGAVRWLLPLPEGFVSLSIEGRCHLTTQDERSTVMLDAIAVGDAGPEQQLAIEPDGVRRWIAAGFAPNARPVSEGTITMAGASTHWYRLRDTTGEPPVPIEILALRRTIGGHHVIVMVFLKEGSSWTWPAAEEWIRGIREPP